eukprot:6658466-Prymnesium_polylepis.1
MAATSLIWDVLECAGQVGERDQDHLRHVPRRQGRPHQGRLHQGGRRRGGRGVLAPPTAPPPPAPRPS